MRRRWKRRALWAALLLGAALLAIPATVAQATAALGAHIERSSIVRKLVLLCVAIVTALAALGAAVASASGTETMAFIAVGDAKSEVRVDVGKKGESPGDSVFFAERLLENGKKVGRTEITCAFYSETAGRCFGTLRLPGGTIEAGGSELGGKSFSVAVLGGTGKYADATGAVRITQLGGMRARYEVELAG